MREKVWGLKAVWGVEQCVAPLSPLKVTEMPGHLLSYRRIKRTWRCEVLQDHKPTHIHTQAQNTSLAPLFLTGLSTTHFLDCLWLFCYDCPRPLPIPRYCSIFDDYSLIKHLFEERWLILLFAGAVWWHGSSETVTRTRHHRGLSGKSFKNSLVTLIIKIYGNDMHFSLGE